MKTFRGSRYVLDLFGEQSSPHEVWSRRNKGTLHWLWLRSFVGIGQVRDIVLSLKLDQVITDLCSRRPSHTDPKGHLVTGHSSNQARSQEQRLAISNVCACALILLSSLKSNPPRVIKVPP